MPVPAQMSQDLNSERPTKVDSKSRTHRIFIHFPKDRNCEVCLRTKITTAHCRRRTGEALLRAEKFGDLITADHKVFNEEGESRNNQLYAVVTQDLATQWVQSYPCKTKTSQETDKSLRKFFSSRHRSQKSFTLRIHWSLDHSVKSCHGISRTFTFIDPRLTALLIERYEEEKKKLQPCCYNQDHMKNVG